MDNQIAVSESITPPLGRSVSIDQAAYLLRVSRRTIYNRIRDGRLRTMRTIGGSQRVLVESLFECGYRPAMLRAEAPASYPIRTVHAGRAF